MTLANLFGVLDMWTRQYLQATSSKPAPQDRARLRAYLFQGLERYRMATVVDAIPTLLHMSLFLFFALLVSAADLYKTLDRMSHTVDEFHLIHPHSQPFCFGNRHSQGVQKAQQKVPPGQEQER